MKNSSAPMVSIAIALLLCTSVYADPDLSLVRVEVGTETATVSVSGGTRIDIVHAVVQELKDTKRSCSSVTVVDFLRLPENKATTARKPTLTVCVGDSLDGGKTTAYIAISPDVPFDVVFDVSEGLGRCGFDDVRLLSEAMLVPIFAEADGG